MPTPNPAAVWHRLFASAHPVVLREALAAGMVPVPCRDAAGRDLLATVLSRSIPLRVYQPGSGSSSEPRLADVRQMTVFPHSLEGRLQFQALALELLERPDVEPFRRQPSVDGVLHGDAAPMDLAVHHGLAAWVEAALARPDAPQASELDAWPPCPDARQGNGLPWLHHAAATSNDALLAVLLEHGLDPNARDGAQRTPVFHAERLPIAERLLDAGASLDLQAGKISLAEHWARRAKKDPYLPGIPALLDLVARHQASTDPSGGPSPADQVKALAWLESVKNDLGFSAGQQRLLEAVRNQWRQGWDAHVAPWLGKGLPLHAWTSTAEHGILKGRFNMAAALGAQWFQVATEKHGGPMPQPLGMFDDPSALLGPQAMEVRKGVTDRGLFALGAALATPELNRLEPLCTQAYVADHRRILDETMARAGSVSQWKAWINETAATLQRPRNAALWCRVATAWRAHLAQVGRAARQAEPARGLEAERDATWDTLRQAIRAGVRLAPTHLYSDKGDLLRRVELLSNSVNPRERLDLSDQETLGQWFATAAVALGDHEAVVDATAVRRASRNEPNPYEALQRALAQEMDKRLGQLSALPAVAPECRASVEAGIAAMARHVPSAPSRWHALGLDATLPSAPSSSPSRRPRM